MMMVDGKAMTMRPPLTEAERKAKEGSASARKGLQTLATD